MSPALARESGARSSSPVRGRIPCCRGFLLPCCALRGALVAERAEDQGVEEIELGVQSPTGCSKTGRSRAVSREGVSYFARGSPSGRSAVPSVRSGWAGRSCLSLDALKERDRRRQPVGICEPANGRIDLAILRLQGSRPEHRVQRNHHPKETKKKDDAGSS